MAIVAQGSGTQTAVIGTTHTLLSVAVNGSFVFEIDLSAMAAGDSLEIRGLVMILTGGTTRVAYYQRFDGAQPVDDLIKIMVPISNELTDATALQFTLKQTAGTGRAFPWKVLKIG